MRRPRVCAGTVDAVELEVAAEAVVGVEVADIVLSWAEQKTSKVSAVIGGECVLFIVLGPKKLEPCLIRLCTLS